jgi:ribonuclease E
MGKNLVIAEEASLAALMDRGRAIEFFFQNTGFSVGDVYTARVENILPSIDAVFVSLGTEKMGFLHASDIPGSGPLSDRVWPKQKLLVQVVKEPTGNKGPRVSTDITLIGRFFVLTTENDNIVMSRRISSANERARLKSIATLLKPPLGFGLVIRTEAMGATDKELEEDFRDLFMDRWKYVIDQFEAQRRPGLILSDSKDLLYRVLRDVFHDGVDSVAVDNEKAAERAKHYLELWSHNPPTVQVLPTKQLLEDSGVFSELKTALSHRIELPSGGYVHIQPTEALTVVDVNSGKFTSSRSPGETVLRTNLEAATEAARQLRLRNVGGVIVIDFIDMDNKFDRLTVLEHFEKLLETDPAHPQIGRLSDLGLVELTRHRQEKNLFEALGEQCSHCSGIGWVFPIFSMFDGNHAHKHSPAEEARPIFSDTEDNDIEPEEERIYTPQHHSPEAQARPQQHQNRQDNRDRYDRQPRQNQPRRSMRNQAGRPQFRNQDRFPRPDGPPSISDLENELLKPADEIQTVVASLNDHSIETTSDEGVLHDLSNGAAQINRVEHPQEDISRSVATEEVIVMPTFSIEEKTKEVLPGIYSFSIDQNE